MDITINDNKHKTNNDNDNNTDNNIDSNQQQQQQQQNILTKYPKFVVPLVDNLSVRRKARAELKARIEPRNDSGLIIEWFKNDVPIETKRFGFGRFSAYFNHGYAALIITNFDEPDNGKYTCVATNSCGTARCQAELRLDCRYQSTKTEAQTREEKLKKLMKIKESMRQQELLDAKRKAELAAKRKREAERELELRRRNEAEKRISRLDWAKRQAAEEAERRRQKLLIMSEQERKKLMEQRQQAAAIVKRAKATGVSADDVEAQNLIKTSYRVLEDSTFLKLERTIYETVKEFEPQADENEFARRVSVRRDQHKEGEDVGEKELAERRQKMAAYLEDELEYTRKLQEAVEAAGVVSADRRMKWLQLRYAYDNAMAAANDQRFVKRPYRVLEDSTILRKEKTIFETIREFEPEEERKQLQRQQQQYQHSSTRATGGASGFGASGYNRYASYRDANADLAGANRVATARLAVTDGTAQQGSTSEMMLMVDNEDDANMNELSRSMSDKQLIDQQVRLEHEAQRRVRYEPLMLAAAAAAADEEQTVIRGAQISVPRGDSGGRGSFGLINESDFRQSLAGVKRESLDSTSSERAREQASRLLELANSTLATAAASDSQQNSMEAGSYQATTNGLSSFAASQKSGIMSNLTNRRDLNSMAATAAAAGGNSAEGDLAQSSSGLTYVWRPYQVREDTVILRKEKTILETVVDYEEEARKLEEDTVKLSTEPDVQKTSSTSETTTMTKASTAQDVAAASTSKPQEHAAYGKMLWNTLVLSEEDDKSKKEKEIKKISDGHEKAKLEAKFNTLKLLDEPQKYTKQQQEQGQQQQKQQQKIQQAEKHYVTKKQEDTKSFAARYKLTQDDEEDENHTIESQDIKSSDSLKFGLGAEQAQKASLDSIPSQIKDKLGVKYTELLAQQQDGKKLQQADSKKQAGQPTSQQEEQKTYRRELLQSMDTTTRGFATDEMLSSVVTRADYKRPSIENEAKVTRIELPQIIFEPERQSPKISTPQASESPQITRRRSPTYEPIKLQDTTTQHEMDTVSVGTVETTSEVAEAATSRRQIPSPIMRRLRGGDRLPSSVDDQDLASSRVVSSELSIFIPSDDMRAKSADRALSMSRRQVSEPIKLSVPRGMTSGLSSSTSRLDDLQSSQTLAKYPRFLKPLLDQNEIRKKSRVELKSRIEPLDDDEMRVEWYKDDVLIEPNYRINSYYNFGYAALIINNFDERDEGRYTCVATNRIGIDKVQCRLQLNPRYKAHEEEEEQNESKRAVRRLAQLQETMKLAEKMEAEKRAEYESKMHVKAKLEIDARLREDQMRTEARRLRSRALAAETASIEAQRRAKTPESFRAFVDKASSPYGTQYGHTRSSSIRSGRSKTLSQREQALESGSDTDKSTTTSRYDSTTGSRSSLVRRPYRTLEDSIILRKEREIYETVTDFVEESPESTDDVSDLDRSLQTSVDGAQISSSNIKDKPAAITEKSMETKPHTETRWQARRLRGGDQIDRTGLAQQTIDDGTDSDSKTYKFDTLKVGSDVGRDGPKVDLSNEAKPDGKLTTAGPLSQRSQGKYICDTDDSDGFKSRLNISLRPDEVQKMKQGTIKSKQDVEATSAKINSSMRVSSKIISSEDSDGFEEDSFIYADLKKSESPSLDQDILKDLDRLRRSSNPKDARRTVIPIPTTSQEGKYNMPKTIYAMLDDIIPCFPIALAFSRVSNY